MDSVDKANIFNIIDYTLERFYQDHADIPEKWLLHQTILTGASRRMLINSLHLQSNMRVLDIGAGFGAMAFDLSASEDLQVTGIDNNCTMVENAISIYESLKTNGGVRSNSTTSFVLGDAYALPFSNSSFDFVISRFVFQHLKNPAHAAQEIERVLTPGGAVCLVDVDDQLSIAYPEELAEYQTLRSAFERLQASRGGDRQVGRKLASYLHSSGLNIVGTMILPSASYGLATHTDTSLMLVLQQFESSKQDMIKGDFITEADYTHCINQVKQQKDQWQFQSNGQVIAIATKPLN